ncbi:DUF6051 family protein [Bacteroidales bacterium OttesenSCG-928-B11]|nr:DUF6051 family protein [Bacteroidales bacterium OttesenSCG-928-E04]MDL2308245.1 DUF6051 family protein [Bacteroidales bacterium OttesenSCG-928-C03]MDL2312877.1 DUF6051 family protein [Bacteroidales bacterium OttesenSCG-928-B11]MDL2326217.1 DUF6051 family protein [Bacteroidales bacterium OttesenSCG-928-A14]
MNYARRSQELKKRFSLSQRVDLQDSGIEIHPCVFHTTKPNTAILTFQKELPISDFCQITDDRIEENSSFNYFIFRSKDSLKSDNAILLLHGLNERKWDKYLVWAEYLTLQTGRPVVLFPIAFHMNRSPDSWFNPRQIMPWLSRRKEDLGEVNNSSFANLALSSRLSNNPFRFYVSGKETIYNLCQFVSEIQKGEHVYFKANTKIDIFAYSIGALLAQVILLANPQKLFSETKLFMFCGGSIFNEMNGNAKDIMDQHAYDKMHGYFISDFIANKELPSAFQDDEIDKAFKMMIRQDVCKEERENFFSKACHRIKAISLKQDIVMPTYGIIKALGKASSKILSELDFPFPYSHQCPFPATSTSADIDRNFKSIFNTASDFFKIY